MTNRKPPTDKPSPTRTYSPQTVKILAARSGNQCAHPACESTLVESRTELSDEIWSGNICHIYALSEGGPRGTGGLDLKERNALDNLIMLCPNHHVIIDRQPKTYSAQTLKRWKRDHENKIQLCVSGPSDLVPPDRFSSARFPTALVDQKIDDTTELLRKTFFFHEVETGDNALVLCRRIDKGDLSGGTAAKRSRALATCAILLVYSEEVGAAEKYVDVAKQLATCTEVAIAEALFALQHGDRKTVLTKLEAIDSPVARSTMLMAVARDDCPEHALDWFSRAGFGAGDLDSDGKWCLLKWQLELGRWEAAEETHSALSDEDLVNTPALYHAAAIACLLVTVPVDLRSYVVKHIPLVMANFPLSSDPPSMVAREKACFRFLEAADTARQLNCPNISSIDERYALWLKLTSPETAEVARKQLKDTLDDRQLDIRMIPFALSFRVNINIPKFEEAIAQNMVRYGEITPEAGAARLALALTQGSPKDCATYLNLHFEDLTKIYDETSITTLKIDMLSRANMSDEAEQSFSRLLGKCVLSEKQQARVRRLISAASGADPVHLAREQFKQTGTTIDLAALVDELAAQQNWQEFCEYGEKLFDRTGSGYDAARLTIAMENAGASDRLVKFLEARPDLRRQYAELQMRYCLALTNEGQLVEARSELLELSHVSEDENYRSLTVYLGIALGDWQSLSAYVATEYQARDSRTGSQLVSTALLAHILGFPYSKDLAFAAAKRGEADADVLVAAYDLAMRAGWDDDEYIAQWIQNALDLSGDNGPVRAMSLLELENNKPEWYHQQSEVLGKLKQGDLPIFVAAGMLKATVVDFTLSAARANLSELDPRRRTLVPAYSGRRCAVAIDAGATAVAIDATALLTLSLLDILDVAFDAFDTIYIPHSTLFWLLEEKRNAAFHQPSRIAKARQVHDMLSEDMLAPFGLSAVADSELAAAVGDDLATLIVEAEHVGDHGETRALVVGPSPVWRVDSLVGETADLRAHAGVMSSCMAVVDKLTRNAQITMAEREKCFAYLRCHEEPWPQQPDIPDGAVLYLGRTAIEYFLHLGILDKLKSAGFTAVVSPGVISEFRALISYESNSDDVADAIERIRKALHCRITSGKVKVGKRTELGQLEGPPMGDHPTVTSLALADVCDAVVIDDRYINQHSTVFSTLDLLDRLVSAGAINSCQHMELRTRLRAAGYVFVPVTDGELTQYLNACSVEDGRVRETAELKAIRENYLCIRMSDWLQLPQESEWLYGTVKTFIAVLKNFWKPGIDLDRAAAISNWMLGQIDGRGWSHRIGPEDADRFVRGRWDGFELWMLTAPLDASDDIKTAYWQWLETGVLDQIKEQFPEYYDWILDVQRQAIANAAETEFDSRDAT